MVYRPAYVIQHDASRARRRESHFEPQGGRRGTMDASVHDETKSPDAALKRSPSTGRSPSAPTPGPQLVPHFPKAEAEALATFEEIPDCVYQASKMGRTRAQDDPTCECSLEYGVEYACTEASGCINRLTQVECLADTCQCGQVCQNQRCVPAGGSTGQWLTAAASSGTSMRRSRSSRRR